MSDVTPSVQHEPKTAIEEWGRNKFMEGEEADLYAVTMTHKKT